MGAILKIYDDEKRVSYDEFYGISTPAMSSKGALMAQEVSEYYLKAIMGEKNIDDTWVVCFIVENLFLGDYVYQ